MQVRSMALVINIMEKSSWINRVNVEMMNMNVMNNWKQHEQMRCMVGRASNRSGVHGSHLPSVDTLDEEVEKEINKGKKDKESKRKHVEKTVDSQLKRSGQDPKSN